MKTQQNSWIWGIVLIVLGGLFLLESLGYIPEFAPLVWSAVFAVGSLFFFANYFRNAPNEWPWLFPAMFMGGLAIVIALVEAELGGTWIGAMFMGCLSLPFWVGYLVDRQENWWATIPGWITAVLTLIILFSNQVAGELIGTFVIWSIALPFFAVYLYSRKQWWALIPAGILATIGLIIPFASQIGADETSGQLVTFVLFLGMAAPFAFLWWRQKEYLTDWAKYPAVGLILFALLTLAFGTQVGKAWPVLLIVLGLWLLYSNTHHPKLKL